MFLPQLRTYGLLLRPGGFCFFFPLFGGWVPGRFACTSHWHDLVLDIYIYIYWRREPARSVSISYILDGSAAVYLCAYAGQYIVDGNLWDCPLYICGVNSLFEGVALRDKNHIYIYIWIVQNIIYRRSDKNLSGLSTQEKRPHPFRGWSDKLEYGQEPFKDCPKKNIDKNLSKDCLYRTRTFTRIVPHGNV